MKQFGVGVIVSTAFIHVRSQNHPVPLGCRTDRIIQLYTHATLMFASECLGELNYEATTSAVVMAGIFLSFLIDYVSHRIVHRRRNQRLSLNGDSSRTGVEPPENGTDKTQGTVHHPTEQHLAGLASNRTSILDVIVLESGIIFHSLRKRALLSFIRVSFSATNYDQCSASPASSPETRTTSRYSSLSCSTSSSKALPSAQSSRTCLREQPNAGPTSERFLLSASCWWDCPMHWSHRRAWPSALARSTASTGIIRQRSSPSAPWTHSARVSSSGWELSRCGPRTGSVRESWRRRP